MAATFTQQIFNRLGLDRLPWDRQLYTYLALLAVSGTPIISYWITNYRNWLALGRGGIPSNPLGWLIQACLHPISRSDLRAPAPWTLEETESVWGEAGRKSFFTGSQLPLRRAGARPQVPTYIAPQRQTTEQADPKMAEKMQLYLSALASANPAIFQLKPSRLEGPFQNAVWISESLPVPAHLKGTKGEFVHRHDEGSTHAVLSLSDTSRAIELGWAERHKLSGAFGEVIPWGYILIYAPRDEAEFEVWKEFVVAAARFNAEAAGHSIGVTSVVLPSA